MTVFVTALHIETEHPMTDTNPMHDQYAVTSYAGGAHTLRVVVAGSSADAAATHRENYPEDAIIRVEQATASVQLTA